MPQPTYGDVHISAALTSISTAYVQNSNSYIADKVFPMVPVAHQTDQYFIFSKSDFLRDEAQQRADATESAGGGFNLTTGSYNAKVWSWHKDLGEQTRRNADPAIDMDVAATKIVTQRLLIRRERVWTSSYLTNGIWSTDITGVASGPSGPQTVFWNDDGNGDPFTDIALGQTTILQNTGMEANTLAMTYPVYQALRKHPLVVDRIKYTNPAFAGTITPDLLAQAFDVERVLVSKAVYNAGIEGGADSFGFVAGKDALLCHVAAEPGLMVPSAGYTFGWEGFTGLNSLGLTVATIPMPWLGLNTVRIEGQMAFDMQVVGADLGYHFSGIVQ
jgi:hypothetical protein